MAESGRLPDTLVRTGMRRLLRRRLQHLHSLTLEQRSDADRAFLDACAAGPVAAVPELANEQHYEVPAAFFAEVLGPHRKYSCCYWGPDTTTLVEAEEEALQQTCLHAGLQNGQTILELGCGWGSLSLWMAEHYPASRIMAVSNSHSQRAWIEQQAVVRGIVNLEVRTSDINSFDPEARFDRVVSVEMFEHVRNHRLLFDRIASWLNPAGRLFVHVFCHHRFAYPFEDTGPAAWMARHFFSGGMMPSQDWLLRSQSAFALKDQWLWDGTHYEKTSNAWLARLDARLNSILPVLQETYGRDCQIWLSRWRMFFMACAELFGYRDGREWFVSHYLFEPRGAGL
jgi:cyclopropane-fatty-acyl-phospholipid synthase